MMDFSSVLIGLSVILAMISPVVYIASMIKGQSKPHRTTRFVVMLGANISFISLLADDSSTAVWLAGAFALRNIVVFLFTIRYGVGGTSRNEIASLVIAVSGLIVWQITDRPLLSLLAVIVADIVGFIPTYVKTWKKPSSEGAGFYSIEAIAVGLNIAAIGAIERDLIFPVYILMVNLVMLLLIKRIQIKSRLMNDY